MVLSLFPAAAFAAVKAVTGIGKWLVKMGTKP